MIAGRLKYRITLLRPVAAGEHTLGQQVEDFKEVATIRAERVRFSGSRQMEAAEPFANYRIEFNIRDAHYVEEGWRVKSDGKLMEVVALEPNRDRGYTKLICERINE